MVAKLLEVDPAALKTALITRMTSQVKKLSELETHASVMPVSLLTNWKKEADDMGMGKTKQVIAFLTEKR